MTRYYAEEPCEKCGECHQGAYYRWDGDDATQCHCPGGVRRELGFAALTAAIDEAATEAGVTWNPNMGPILRRAAALGDPE